MFSQAVVPRVYRSIRRAVTPVRQMSRLYRRDIPIFPWRRYPADHSWGDLWHNFFGPQTTRRGMDNHFAEMRKFMDSMMPRDCDTFYVRPRDVPGAQSEATQVRINPNQLEVKLDVHQFHPEELKVSVTENKLVITGRHEQRADDHGFISREFTREFSIPENIDSESITSTISEEGVLLVKGQPKEAPKQQERVIDIKKEEKTIPENKDSSS